MKKLTAKIFLTIQNPNQMAISLLISNFAVNKRMKQVISNNHIQDNTTLYKVHLPGDKRLINCKEIIWKLSL